MGNNSFLLLFSILFRYNSYFLNEISLKMKIILSICIVFVIFFNEQVFAKKIQYDTLANDERCLTFQKIKKDNKIQKKITFDPQTGRPINQREYSSASGLFLIHYDTSGVNAVPNEDKNNNGIPDFVDSVAYYADYVYNKEVVEFGFKSPIGDSLVGGSNAYDIYLYEIGDGDKVPDSTGEQDMGGTYGMTIAEKEILPALKFPRMTSYMIIDNNYSPLDSIYYPDGKVTQAYKVFGIDGVKITLAHEFHHAIQYMYGIDEPVGSELAEMSSVTMENTLFPEIKDYLQYVRSLFKYPSQYILSNATPDNGYRYSIFIMMLRDKYGIEVLRNIWELIGSGVHTFKALDSALVLKNTSINNEWLDFLDWIYFTSYRTVDNKYFKDAALMPIFTYETASEYTYPSISLGGYLTPYQIRCDQIYFKNNFPTSNDTLNIVISCLDSNALFYQLSLNDEFTQIVCSQNAGNYTRIFPNSPNEYYYNLQNVSNKVKVKLHEIPSVETYAIEKAYPNPFRINTDDEIIFPAPKNAGISEDVILTLYDSSLRQIISKTLQVGLENKNRVVILSKQDLMNISPVSTGVYVYRADYNGNVVLGKIAIINQ
jgi:hypothetical protein